jgi:RNA polymerase sigma-70 factor (ECF subfamily)
MGNADDFDAFYLATRQRLLHQMYAMTGNLADAQDCVQEAYARAWQHWADVAQHVNPEAWLRTVAWRIAASRWRKLKNGIAALTRHGPPGHAPEPSPDNVALVEALKEIPEAQRRAIVLHHLVGLSVDEIAQETGVAIGTVKARLSRGRTALAQLLREDDAPSVDAAEETQNAR